MKQIEKDIQLLEAQGQKVHLWLEYLFTQGTVMTARYFDGYVDTLNKGVVDAPNVKNIFVRIKDIKPFNVTSLRKIKVINTHLYAHKTLDLAAKECIYEVAVDSANYRHLDCGVKVTSFDPERDTSAITGKVIDLYKVTFSDLYSFITKHNLEESKPDPEARKTNQGVTYVTTKGITEGCEKCPQKTFKPTKFKVASVKSNQEEAMVTLTEGDFSITFGQERHYSMIKSYASTIAGLADYFKEFDLLRTARDLAGEENRIRRTIEITGDCFDYRDFKLKDMQGKVLVLQIPNKGVLQLEYFNSGNYDTWEYILDRTTLGMVSEIYDVFLEGLFVYPLCISHVEDTPKGLDIRVLCATYLGSSETKVVEFPLYYIGRKIENYDSGLSHINFLLSRVQYTTTLSHYIRTDYDLDSILEKADLLKYLPRNRKYEPIAREKTGCNE